MSLLLIIKSFINKEQIDEIHIQNTGHYKGKFWEYRIREPQGIITSIYHRRDDGYIPLLQKALQIIKGIKP